ncbi:FMN-binding glutamate synthase family protein [Dasania marina]|uniref:FMN-binding glutamate synthase family protein n=1 Tax=Dasania marina TaxID=471499 RepID=UPI0030D6D47C|tara:strand:- start:76899 stop:78539 length:1641 start_codon:yes stop_codon:yes gene_type:complete
MRKEFIIFSIIIVITIIIAGQFWSPLLSILWIVIPLIGLGIYDIKQSRHALRRNFPVFGRGRWVMEYIRPFLRQYFFESETDGAPVNRMFRSVIYRRAKGELDTVPYGTQLDTQRVGYEWIGHSLSAKHLADDQFDPRIIIGGPKCTQPYSASILNISAMSFGALSNNAIRALNLGAKKGGFYHNTGEGSASDYHLENGGDLVWQIGTAYFGCRDAQGEFDGEKFKEMASRENIKMIEIKLSQGAKPGHGGILPADKNTSEIARIRGVEPYTTVVSPPSHSTFSTPLEMVEFIQTLRDLSGGKPIGFKLCIGRKSEFISICKAMQATGIYADFITVDGGEGGTGAAPLEYSNSVGMPLREALSFVCDALIGFDLKKDIKVIASAKVFTGFHIVKLLSLGADLCNSARGMMIAAGCVQSLTCNNNKCPVGIATQDPELAKGLVVSDKSLRVTRFHNETVKAAMEIVASAGLKHPSELNRSYIYRRISETKIQRYDQIYVYPQAGSLLTNKYPENFIQSMAESSKNSFIPVDQFAEFNTGLAELHSGL